MQIESINIIYPNVENMIVVPLTERMEIIISIQVFLISRMNFDYTKKGGKESFSSKTKASISRIQTKTTRMEIIMGIHVYLISRMNINYKENGLKKRFSWKSRLQYRVSKCREHDCSANKQIRSINITYPN